MMQTFSKIIVLVMTFSLCGAAFAQSGSITQDEHDKQIKADTERNTKYHNNADDYPTNGSKPLVPTPPARIPATRKDVPYVDPVAAAKAAHIDGVMKGEFAADLAKANKGNADGIYGAALGYEHGYGTTRDLAKALELYMSIADQSDLAAYEAGYLLFNGSEFTNAIPVNEAKGRQFMNLAASHGYDKAISWKKYHPEAVSSGANFPEMQQYAAEVFQEQGEGLPATTDAESERLLHLKRGKDGRFSYKTIEKEDTNALNAARANLHGIGVPVNTNRAYKLFLLFSSSEFRREEIFWIFWKDNPAAMHDVTRSTGDSTPWMYEHALYASSTGNMTEARKVMNQTLYGQGAHPRPVQMLVDLGVMELEGKGGTQDVPKGLARLKQAVALGNKNGQYTLGVIYERGLFGVPKDNAQAMQLLQAAAGAGQVQAKEYLAKSGAVAQGH
ncbi:MAG: hypothetical protein ABI142_12360 [Bryocella sp.]